MAKDMISVCGLDCESCPAHVALINDDNELRGKTAQEWSKCFGHDFSAADINCVGCRKIEGIHGGYCEACPLRACAFNKKIANCCACAEFASCQKCKEFEAHSGMSIKNNFLVLQQKS